MPKYSIDATLACFVDVDAETPEAALAWLRNVADGAIGQYQGSRRAGRPGDTFEATDTAVEKVAVVMVDGKPWA